MDISIFLKNCIYTMLSVFITLNMADIVNGTELKNNTFHMAANRPNNSKLFTFWNIVYTEVFRRAGFNMKIEYYPIKRASLELSKGRVDCEPARIHNYAAMYTDIIRVDEPMYNSRIFAWSADSDGKQLNGWESLKGKDLKIEYARGVKSAEVNLLRVVGKKKLTSITKAEQGLIRLILGRTDLYIDGETVVLPYLELAEFKGKIFMAGEMVSRPLYLYLHKKHKELAPQLAGIIKSLKEEGLVDHYFNEVFVNIAP